MGSSISSIVNKLKQQGDLKAQAEDELILSALLIKAALKYNNFVAQVKDASDSTLIPVDKILVMNYQVNAGVTNNADNIKTAITNAGKAFVSGDSLDGVPRNFLRDFPLTAPSTGLAAVIGAGLDAMFGSVVANQAERTTYAITCGDLGGIMRIDINTVCYTFSSTALAQVTNNVVSVAYTISSVDASKLDKSTIRDIVQVCYGGFVPPDQLLAIYQQIIAAFDATRAGGSKSGVSS
ncbi:hypothetical protein B0H14DRAFT_2842715 [Mycena olivaceomarginata]|nr:hypothetical protein B0H14DRAFT_2987660 [Mycena olivaceomarginata]KAJ7817393.1 hypothetical protein B0H14DRAFT_2842715 [Mycena olivaceomarginata]